MAKTKELHNVWEHIASYWVQTQSEVRRQWSKLTDDDLLEIRGQREKLLSKIQMRYGLAKDEAERQMDKWAEHLQF